MIAATLTTCEACFAPDAVCEISVGGWEVRCGHCDSCQLGLPGCDPPPATDPSAPVALGFAFESGPPAAE